MGVEKGKTPSVSLMLDSSLKEGAKGGKRERTTPTAVAAMRQRHLPHRGRQGRVIPPAAEAAAFPP